MGGGTQLPPVLGFDPGLSGAATLLGEGGVDAVWAWRPRQRGGERVFQLVIVTRASEFRPLVQLLPTLSVVGTRVATLAVKGSGRMRFPVWQEAAHVGGGVRNVKTSIRIGWISGALVGPSERYAEGRKIREVQAATWRHRLLGLSIRTKREPAKAASVRFVPPRLPGMTQAVEAICGALSVQPDDLDHVTDSGGVAEFGRRFPDG